MPDRYDRTLTAIEKSVASNLCFDSAAVLPAPQAMVAWVIDYKTGGTNQQLDVACYHRVSLSCGGERPHTVWYSRFTTVNITNRKAVIDIHHYCCVPPETRIMVNTRSVDQNIQ